MEVLVVRAVFLSLNALPGGSELDEEGEFDGSIIPEEGSNSNCFYDFCAWQKVFVCGGLSGSSGVLRWSDCLSKFGQCSLSRLSREEPEG